MLYRNIVWEEAMWCSIASSFRAVRELLLQHVVMVMRSEPCFSCVLLLQCVEPGTGRAEHCVYQLPMAPLSFSVGDVRYLVSKSPSAEERLIYLCSASFESHLLRSVEPLYCCISCTRTVPPVQTIQSTTINSCSTHLQSPP